MLARLSLFLAVNILADPYCRRVVVLSNAPLQLQSCSSSDQDATQVQAL